MEPVSDHEPTISLSDGPYITNQTITVSFTGASSSTDWQETAAARARAGKAKAAGDGKRKRHEESEEATGAADQQGAEKDGERVVYKLDRRNMRAAVRSFS